MRSDLNTRPSGSKERLSRPRRVSDPPRLIVCPRLDLGEGAEIEDLAGELDCIEGLEPSPLFSTEREARGYFEQVPSERLEPVFQAPAPGDYPGRPFGGSRLATYGGIPAEDALSLKIRFAIECPVRCTLSGEWSFPSLEQVAREGPAHQRIGRHPDNLPREMLEALYEVENALRQEHPRLTVEALRDFWSSFEIYKHLKLHALRMLRFYGHELTGRRGVWASLASVRRLLGLYVDEILCGKGPAARRSPAEVIGAWLAKNRISKSELAGKAGISRNTLHRIMKGETVRSQSIAKVAEEIKCDYHDLVT